MLEMNLRGRRPQVYANHYLQHQVSGKVELENSLKTVEEARQRLLKLGVTPPTIEGDYEEVDASTDSQQHHGIKKAHSVLEIDTALEEWKTSEARNSFWYYRQLMNSSLLLTHQ